MEKRDLRVCRCVRCYELGGLGTRTHLFSASTGGLVLQNEKRVENEFSACKWGREKWAFVRNLRHAFARSEETGVELERKIQENLLHKQQTRKRFSLWWLQHLFSVSCSVFTSDLANRGRRTESEPATNSNNNRSPFNCLPHSLRNGLVTRPRSQIRDFRGANYCTLCINQEHVLSEANNSVPDARLLCMDNCNCGVM